ncbi:MAG: type II toxin-antitoxin system VapC family toxin [Candidatus Dormibacteria bacterium]
MSLLLDTHIILWWLNDDRRLHPDVRLRIQETTNVLVSTASVWEVSIKRGLAKLRVPDDWTDHVTADGFQMLPVHLQHARAVAKLPPLHRDPFDRMLIVQAQLEGSSIVSLDPRIHRYEVDVVPGR